MRKTSQKDPNQKSQRDKEVIAKDPKREKCLVELRKKLQRSDRTQQEIADEAGVSRGYLNLWLNGKGGAGHNQRAFIESVAEALQCDEELRLRMLSAFCGIEEKSSFAEQAAGNLAEEGVLRIWILTRQLLVATNQLLAGLIAKDLLEGVEYVMFSHSARHDAVSVLDELRVAILEHLQTTPQRWTLPPAIMKGRTLARLSLGQFEEVSEEVLKARFRLIQAPLWIDICPWRIRFQDDGSTRVDHVRSDNGGATGIERIDASVWPIINQLLSNPLRAALLSTTGRSDDNPAAPADSLFERVYPEEKVSLLRIKWPVARSRVREANDDVSQASA